MAIDAGTLQVKTEIDLRGFEQGIREIVQRGNDIKLEIELDSQSLKRQLSGSFRDVERDSDRAGGRSGDDFARSFERSVDRRSARTFDGMEDGARQAGGDSGRAFSRNFLDITERDLLSIRGGFFGRIGGEIANRTVLGFTRALRNGLRGAFETLFEFEARRSNLFTLGVNQNAVAEQATDVNAALGTQISDLEALEANYSLVSAGISEFQARSEALAATIRLTVGGNADAVTSVELLTKAYANFGADFDVIADTVSAGVIQGQFDLQGLARAFPNVSQGAARYGLTIQETTALIASMSQETKNVTTAVTQVKPILRLAGDH